MKLDKTKSSILTVDLLPFVKYQLSGLRGKGEPQLWMIVCRPCRNLENTNITQSMCCGTHENNSVRLNGI